MTSRREPIAIVGIGCRYPGGITDPASFWRVLERGEEVVGPCPPGRLAVAGHGHDLGGFVDGIELFDADFFGISPHEAARMDPQQRLLLEVTWEALEDAGQPVEQLAGSQTGAFVGAWLADYEAHLFRSPEGADFHMTTGSGRYSLAGRLSYAFGLHGPSLTVDTACSSSLVALHLACRSLWDGETTLALAAGVNIILDPSITDAYGAAGMLSPGGRCRFGDALADGYVRSEGAAVVVLRRLADAVAAGDRIRAVVRGSAVNNDGGAGGSLGTPAVEGQRRLLLDAWRDAGVAPEALRYVEAHGTGTRVGDPVEISALAEALGGRRSSACLIGSVKTNLGHTEGAAGMAGVTKVVLALEHGLVPASLHCEEATPAVPWDSVPVTIPSVAVPLDGDPAEWVAGVTSLGISGTNAHVVLASAPPVGERSSAPSTAPLVLPLSARSEDALRELAGRYRELLETQPAADVCLAARTTRGELEYRLAVVARSSDDLASELEAFQARTDADGLVTGRCERGASPRVVYVFSGQGSQWAGMGWRLRSEEPVVKAALDRCERALAPHVDWSLEEVLSSGRAGAEDAPPDVVQPTLFALQVALAELLRSWGVEPAAVVGHSMGEVAAAHVAGALDLESAAHVICSRSRLLARTRPGAMAVLGLDPDAAAAALAGVEGRIGIAAINGPGTTVVSGDPGAVESVVERLTAENVFCRRVRVDVAAHSPAVEPVLAELAADLGGLEASRPLTPLYSTVTGDRLDEPLDGDYWAANLRQPVLFAEAVERLLGSEETVFVELSPHPVLLQAVEQTADRAGRPVLAVPLLHRDADTLCDALGALARLWTRGARPAWAAAGPEARHARTVPLPTYPWQRRRHWLERAATGLPDGDWDPVLGEQLPEVAALGGADVWQTTLGAARAALAGPEDVPGVLAELARRSAARCGDGRAWRVLRADVDLPSTDLPDETPLQLAVRAEGDEAEVTVFAARGEEGWSRMLRAELAPADARHGWTYGIGWRPAEPDATREVQTRGWLVVADRGGVGDALALLLDECGGRCVVVRDAAREEVAAALARGDAVLHLLNLDADDVTEVCESLLGALQAVTAAGGRLVVVTRGAETVAGDGGPWVPARAASWGLVRGALAERGDAEIQLVDLPPAPADPGSEASRIAALLAAPMEPETVLRDASPLVPRLERLDLAAGSPREPWLRGDGSYLVTGGLGAVGLAVAGALARAGARSLVLTGRRGLTDDAGARTAIEALEAAGVDVAVVRADVADRAAMEALFAELGVSRPPLRGIVHGAGVLTPTPLADLDADALAAVLRPKAYGALLLHELSAGLQLDLFVLLSSAAGVLGSRELAHYAAANRFLDALGQYRRRLGLPATSVQSGLWAGDGIAAGLEGFFGSVGLRPMASDQAAEAVLELAAAEVGEAVLADVDWSVFAPLYAAGGRGPLLEELAPELAQEMAPSAPARTLDLAQLVRDEVAAILGFDSGDLPVDQGFFRLGMDSVMSVRLRGRLEAALGRPLPATIALEYPTVERLTAYLSLLEGGATSADAPAPAEPPVPEASLADAVDRELAALSELLGRP